MVQTSVRLQHHKVCCNSSKIQSTDMTSYLKAKNLKTGSKPQSKFHLSVLQDMQVFTSFWIYSIKMNIKYLAASLFHFSQRILLIYSLSNHFLSLSEPTHKMRSFRSLWLIIVIKLVNMKLLLGPQVSCVEFTDLQFDDNFSKTSYF